LLILGIDTSCPRGSLAIGEVGTSARLLAESSWQREKSHSELVLVALDEALKQAGARLQDLGAVAVGVGPGSFTGLRVGLNVARSLGYGLDMPLWPVSSLRLWAEPHARDTRPILVLVNAFRNLLYVGLYRRHGDRLKEEWLPRALSVEETIAQFPPGEIVVCGDGWSTFQNFWPEDFAARASVSTVPWPEAKDLLPMMVEGSTERRNFSWPQVKPLYIRGSEAEEKLRQGLLKPLPRVQE
jgi:tRNA threonylcarbamoyladenosine biosynthesis protein TsaB